MNVEELTTIKNMLNIPLNIAYLEKELANVSREFLSTHSIIGGMMKDQCGYYTRGLDPYQALIIITTNEEAIKRRIERYTRRYVLFIDEFTTEELKGLREAINQNKSTLLTQRAYEWIGEIEYYLTAKYKDDYLINNQKELQAEIEETESLENEFEEMMRGVIA